MCFPVIGWVWVFGFVCLNWFGLFDFNLSLVFNSVVFKFSFTLYWAVILRV